MTTWIEKRLVARGYNLEELDRDNPYTVHIGKDCMVVLPTPITDGIPRAALVALRELAQQLERDAMSFALRLYGEDPDTFSPETRECMERWRPRVAALLAGG